MEIELNNNAEINEEKEKHLLDNYQFKCPASEDFDYIGIAFNKCKMKIETVQEFKYILPLF